MVEGLLRRARQIIGLDDEPALAGEVDAERTEPMDVTAALKGNRKKDSVQPDYEVAVYEPKVYEDSLQIGTQLRKGNPVVINLIHLDQHDGTRLIDFVCGTAYAIDGHMLKIGESIFLFTPARILISNMEEREHIESTFEGGAGNGRHF